MASRNSAPMTAIDSEGDGLISMEHLGDRASPELWPEQMPGVKNYASLVGATTPFSNYSSSNPRPKWMRELETDDVNMLQELGSLTPSQLVDKVRQLQNLAYQLGLEEAREMTRGRMLNILEKPSRTS